MSNTVLVGTTQVPLASVTDAIRLAATHGANALQIALGPPDSHTVRSLEDSDVKTVLAIRKKHKFYVVVHGKYFYNFCRTEAWQEKMLLTELQQASKIGAAVIIHQGKNMAELGLSHSSALDTYVSNIVRVLEKWPGSNHDLIIENSAHQGTELGYSLDELSQIFQRIPPEYQHRVGFCLDLCHIFVAGELDMRDGSAVRAWLARLDQYALPLCVVHFNDSAIKFAGANDHHAGLGQGYIGSASEDGFREIIRYCVSRGIPMILETPSVGHTKEIAYIKGIAQTVL